MSFKLWIQVLRVYIYNLQDKKKHACASDVILVVMVERKELPLGANDRFCASGTSGRASVGARAIPRKVPLAMTTSFVPWNFREGVSGRDCTCTH
jgi:hypothetical protein